MDWRVIRERWLAWVGCLEVCKEDRVAGGVGGWLFRSSVQRAFFLFSSFFCCSNFLFSVSIHKPILHD